VEAGLEVVADRYDSQFVGGEAVGDGFDLGNDLVGGSLDCGLAGALEESELFRGVLVGEGFLG
jgi:hypothetical protein